MEVPRRDGITQSALSQMERMATNNRTATLKKPTHALKIEAGLLVELIKQPTTCVEDTRGLWALIIPVRKAIQIR